MQRTRRCHIQQEFAGELPHAVPSQLRRAHAPVTLLLDRPVGRGGQGRFDSRIPVLPEGGQQAVAKPIPSKGGICVAGVLAPCDSPLPQVVEDLATGDIQHRPHDLPSQNWPNAAQTGAGRAPKQAEEHSLGLVRASVGGGHDAAGALCKKMAEEVVATAPPGLLQVPAASGAVVRRVFPPHEAGVAQALGQGLHESLIPFRFRTPQAVVQMDDANGPRRVQFSEGVQQGHRVRASRHCYADAAGIGEHAVAGNPTCDFRQHNLNVDEILSQQSFRSRRASRLCRRHGSYPAGRRSTPGRPEAEGPKRQRRLWTSDSGRARVRNRPAFALCCCATGMTVLFS